MKLQLFKNFIYPFIEIILISCPRRLVSVIFNLKANVVKMKPEIKANLHIFNEPFLILIILTGNFR